MCRLVGAGASVEQAAEQLGLTVRSVQSHLTRARRVLRHLAAGSVVVLAGVAAGLLHATTGAAVSIAATLAVAWLPHQGGPLCHSPVPQAQDSRTTGGHQGFGAQHTTCPAAACPPHSAASIHRD